MKMPMIGLLKSCSAQFEENKNLNKSMRSTVTHLKTPPGRDRIKYTRLRKDPNEEAEKGDATRKGLFMYDPLGDGYFISKEMTTTAKYESIKNMSESIINQWKNILSEQLNFTDKDKIMFEIDEKPKRDDKLPPIEVRLFQKTKTIRNKTESSLNRWNKTYKTIQKQNEDNKEIIEERLDSDGNDYNGRLENILKKEKARPGYKITHKDIK